MEDTKPIEEWSPDMEDDMQDNFDHLLIGEADDSRGTIVKGNLKVILEESKRSAEGPLKKAVVGDSARTRSKGRDKPFFKIDSSHKNKINQLDQI